MKIIIKDTKQATVPTVEVWLDANKDGFLTIKGQRTDLPGAPSGNIAYIFADGLVELSGGLKDLGLIS